VYAAVVSKGAINDFYIQGFESFLLPGFLPQPNRSLSIARVWRANRNMRSNAGRRLFQARYPSQIRRRSAFSYGSDSMAYLYPPTRITSFWKSSRRRLIFRSSKYKRCRSCVKHAAAHLPKLAVDGCKSRLGGRDRIVSTSSRETCYSTPAS